MVASYHSLTVEEVFKAVGSSLDGLTAQEAKKRLDEHGYNELKREKKFTALILFINQFKNALLILLIFAGILSLMLGEKIEAMAIFGILLLNTILGFVQEYRAEKAIEALQKISAPTAKVLRDEKEQIIPAKELVMGDIILLETGDIVPADSRLIEVSNLQIDEASLTGESFSSNKSVGLCKANIPITDQKNMAFMGTIVNYGRGTCIVTNIGMHTEFGKIASSLQTTKDVQTPLQVKFTQLAKQISFITVILIIIVLIAGILEGTLSFARMLLFALALTVSTIPNSLPIIVTISLSMGAKRLAKRNMLIKKLPVAESLGSTTIICSDKTGTITKNEMTITNIYSNSFSINVTGIGYKPEGHFYCNQRVFNPQKIELLLRAGYLCNNAKLNLTDKRYSIIGDPTEASLLVLARKAGYSENYFNDNFSTIEEFPFDSDRKMMSVIYRNKINKRVEAYVKGAPDVLLKHCNSVWDNGKIRKLTDHEKKNILDINNSFAKKALRVLGIAYKQINVKQYNQKETESELIFIGLVGMIDPPRLEVTDSIKKCTESGIKVMMITGDHLFTARAIAEQIGLLKQKDMILTGEELDKLNDNELESCINNIRIVARILPIQKLRIVNALQKKGHIVAMTGDGVNDAPALKKADIGIVMGITGTDVAKEVSKAILVDDNFATIVSAVEEGRNIYNKMIKSARYLLSCNSGEISAVFIGILLFPQNIIILPLMLLLMSLLTDDFPALGLGLEPIEKEIMKLPPRNPKEKPINSRMFFSIIMFGLIMGLGTLFIFTQYNQGDIAKAQTMAFTTLVMFQMFAVISSRKISPSLKSLNPFSNIWLLGAICLSLIIQIIVIYWSPLQIIFGTVPLLWIDWIKILIISSLGFVMMEFSKFVMNQLDKKVVYKI